MFDSRPKVSCLCSACRGGGNSVAFTLAEVLITLGIIGVVSALTIPNLVAKYRKQAVETKLKKTYSVLYNALRYSENENGNLQYPAKELWQKNTYYSSTEFFDTYVSPYLNNIINSYTGRIADTVSSGNPECTKTIVFADNTRISYFAEVKQWPWNKNAPLILGNINIMFGSNKDKLVSGKNYFGFTLGYAQMGNSKLDLIFIYSGGDYGTDPNIVAECGENVIKEKCVEGDAVSCTQMIYCNGWKIPDDYPIRF